MVNTILKEADLFCPNSVRINFTIYHIRNLFNHIRFVSKQNSSSLRP
ncbi:ABC transporter ATP-binding protein [Lentilactobacillus hilgardii]|nr:ABC transporter ATP-binding protein [Lentilactobacillus hilgardii]